MLYSKLERVLSLRKLEFFDGGTDKIILGRAIKRTLVDHHSRFSYDYGHIYNLYVFTSNSDMAYGLDLV